MKLQPVADRLDDLAPVAPGPIDKTLHSQHVMQVDRGTQTGDESGAILDRPRRDDKALEIIVVVLGLEVVQ